MSAEARLAELGIVLPAPTRPIGNYVAWRIGGGLLFLAGVGPRGNEPALASGQVGKDLTVTQGYQAARACGMNLLANMRAALGSLDRVKRIVKLNIFVASTAEFFDQPLVGNGASDLMVAVFGEAGRHARSAVGVAALPRGVAVEIDAVVQVG